MRIREWSLVLVLSLAAVIVSLTCETAPASGQPTTVARDFRVVHVFVVLCDNATQGIVPVPAALGNGQEPASNLYWGAQYGADTFFRRSPHWKALTLSKPLTPHVLARSAFISTGSGTPTIVFMEAWNGAQMKTALGAFFRAAAGGAGDVVDASDGARQYRFPAGAGADLVCFVGHNGLMDNKLDAQPERRRDASGPKAAVVLACKSNSYFAGPLRRAGCSALLTTAQLMAPEAYTLDAAVRSWAAGESSAEIRDRAAEAYAKYQRIPVSSARTVFVAGAAE